MLLNWCHGHLSPWGDWFEKLSGRKTRLGEIWKFSPVFIVTVVCGLGTFLTSKNSENFFNIPQDVSYNFRVLSFSRFGRLDAQKNQKRTRCISTRERSEFGAFCTFLDGSLNDLKKLWNFTGTFLRMLVTTFMF